LFGIAARIEMHRKSHTKAKKHFFIVSPFLALIDKSLPWVLRKEG
jgi:hypothetical protein